MKAVDLSKVYKNYKGLWVALKDGHSNKVVATGRSLKGVVKEAEKKGFPGATVMRVPKQILVMPFALWQK